MRRLALIVSAFCAAFLIAALTPTGSRSAPAQTEPVLLDVGGRMQVVGAPIGCRVALMNAQKVIDCRVARPLAGTYGVLFSERRVLLVRFRNGGTAKVVVTAHHHGTFTVCR